MDIKVVKIVPNEFKNESRDLRELSVLKSLGCDITVVAKEGGHENYGYRCVRLSTRPLKYISNLTLNRAASMLVWANQVRKMHPHIVSCHDLISLVIGWEANLFSTNKAQLVYDSHEFEYARDESRGKLSLFLIKHVERFLMRRSAFSMMVNDSIADAVMNLHCLKEKPVVVRNFPPKWIIDENEIEKRRNAFLSENCLPNNAKIVLYQGALSKRRGIENAIKAISYLGEDYYLVILGNGLSAYVESLQKIVGDLRLSSRVFFIPAVSYTELWKYTGIADVGLCILENVCTNHFFALPNKFSEYIQSLVPVVSSNFPELVRIIDRYNVGIYCNADDPKELSNAISKVLSSKEVVLCYKENLKLAKEVLNWERESKVLTKAYGELISNIKVSK